MLIRYSYCQTRGDWHRRRAWFDTKEAPQAEATELNIARRKLGRNAVSLDAVLAETARDGATRLKPFGKAPGRETNLDQGVGTQL